jgi:hypothetical protein
MNGMWCEDEAGPAGDLCGERGHTLIYTDAKMAAAGLRFLPTKLAPEARELLLTFTEWCGRERQRGMLESDEWTMEQMVDAFIMECTGA